MNVNLRETLLGAFASTLGPRHHLPLVVFAGVGECEVGATAPSHAQPWGGASWNRKTRVFQVRPSAVGEHTGRHCRSTYGCFSIRAWIANSVSQKAAKNPAKSGVSGLFRAGIWRKRIYASDRRNLQLSKVRRSALEFKSRNVRP